MKKRLFLVIMSISIYYPNYAQDRATLVQQAITSLQKILDNIHELPFIPTCLKNNSLISLQDLQQFLITLKNKTHDMDQKKTDRMIMIVTKILSYIQNIPKDYFGIVNRNIGPLEKNLQELKNKLEALKNSPAK